MGLIVLLVAAVSAMWWLDTLRDPDPVDEAPPEARHEPDFYFNDFRLRAHERSGPPGYVIEGERLVHYADDDTAEMTEPRLRLDSGDGAPWRVRSRLGTLSPDGDVLELREDVFMRRDAAARPPLVLRTTRMTVFTEAQRAETDQPVTIVSPGQRIAAVGMTARFATGQIEFHRDVRGDYDPTIAP
ncbi:MAG: LPS export ABC transporter periplasmic protein LptC [Halofilum sp. (in: g-proteobacteria)]